jgi:anti-sigma regulatory factor (Ser/Thr protein kinase)
MYTAIRLTADASSASSARRSVEWFSAAVQTDPGVALLVTTELVSNAVRHGAAPIVLLLRAHGRQLLVEVTDCGGGRVQTRPPHAAPDVSEGGFGLALVAHVATEWGVRPHGSRCKTVWARLTAEPAPLASAAPATRDVGLVSERGCQEREIAASERDRADLERKLAHQAGEGALLDWRAAAMHRAAASVHHAAAALHEWLASLADQHTQALFNRYS